MSAQDLANEPDEELKKAFLIWKFDAEHDEVERKRNAPPMR